MELVSDDSPVFQLGANSRRSPRWIEETEPQSSFAAICGAGALR